MLLLIRARLSFDAETWPFFAFRAKHASDRGSFPVAIIDRACDDEDEMSTRETELFRTLAHAAR